MNCPVCLSSSTRHELTGTDFLFETTPRTFALDVCTACRCLFLNPPPSAEELHSFYPATYWWSGSRPTALKRLESLYRRIALHDHISFIEAAAPTRRTLLDYGCGSGTLIGLLKRRGFDVLGVDFSEEASRVAAEENGVRVIVAPSLEKAGLKEDSFDVVTLFHVMEHVTNPREVLASVRPLLRSEGKLIIQVPNIDSWQFGWFGARWYGLDIPRHVIDYNRQAMAALLSAAGFEVVRIRQFNLRDNAPALASSLLPALDPVSRSIRNRRRGEVEGSVSSWFKHLAYLLLVIASYPVARLEAACGRGATVMIEARKVR